MSLITGSIWKTRGIRYYAFTDSSDIVRRSVPERRKLIHRALIIREKIIDMFRKEVSGVKGWLWSQQ